ncbi:MAG: hypothetical protein JKX97_07140 [Candidatus Lindowbacteria bacterium]|nr:hypothetical protein [Candidatus Lindowbacteria bacterium]
MGCCVLLIILVFTASTAAFLMINDEYLQKHLSDNFGRTVTFSSVEPGLFKISINGLQIADEPGFEADPILTVGTIDFYYSIRSLFKGDFVVKEAVLSDAILAVEVDLSGRSNVRNILSPAKEGSRISIHNLVFRDLAVSYVSADNSFRVDRISGRLTDVNRALIGYELATKNGFSGGSLWSRGTYNPISGSIKADLRGEKVDLSSIPYGRYIDVDLIGVQLGFDGVIHSTGDTTFLKTKFSASNLLNGTTNILVNWRDLRSSKGKVFLSSSASNLRRFGILKSYIDTWDVDGNLKVHLGMKTDQGRIQGIIESEELHIKGKKLSRLRAPFVLTKKDIYFTDMTIGVFGGECIATLLLGFSSTAPLFDLELNTAQTDASLLVKELTGYSGLAGGTASGRIQLSGIAGQKHTYNGRGLVDLTDFDAGTLGLFSDLSYFLNHQNWQVRNFDDARYEFAIARGNVIFDSPARFSNKNLTLLIEGKLAMNGYLDGEVTARIPASKGMKKIGKTSIAAILGVRKDTDTVMIPFKVKGSLHKPRFEPRVRKTEMILAEFITKTLGLTKNSDF